MNGYAKFLLTCVAIIVGAYGVYHAIFPTYYVRYRLTLDVDVDGVTRTGSGVVEISYQIIPDGWINWYGGSHFHGVMHGNAITVDLGDRGLLFVVDSRPLLSDPKTGVTVLPDAAYLGSLPLAAYGFPQDGLPSRMREAVRQLQHKKGPVEVALPKLPMLVRFQNISDRDSIEEVDPRDLSIAFGSGTRLTRAIVTLTDAPVTPIPPIWPKWLVREIGEGFKLPAFGIQNGRMIPIDTTAFKGE
jgi:hypothetical protein